MNRQSPKMIKRSYKPVQVDAKTASRFLGANAIFWQFYWEKAPESLRGFFLTKSLAIFILY